MVCPKFILRNDKVNWWNLCRNSNENAVLLLEDKLNVLSLEGNSTINFTKIQQKIISFIN